MKINLSAIFRILLFALFFSIVALCYSCGASKSDKTKTKEEIKTEASNKSTVDASDESNVKKTEKTTVDDQNQTTTKETTYEPIDNTKPSSIIDADGKETKLNNSKKTTRETTQKNNTKTAVAKASDENHKSKTSAKSESNNKSSAKKAGLAVKRENKGFSFWNLLWLLIPATVIWWVWKNKTKIIAWFNGL
ncbi:MAG: hypothetical protein H7Y10_12310 [Flavobacterium sp.]|nr:hypothetical protein [Flavobacterium sp.]